MCHESSTDARAVGATSSDSARKDDCMVMAAHIQNTTVLNQNTNSLSSTRGRPDHDHLPLSLDSAPVVTSCGHAMHATCYQDKMDKLVEKENETYRQT